MTVKELIKELKEQVTFNKEDNKHYMDNTILTNQEIDYILTNIVGDEYTKLSSKKRTKLRQKIFEELM